MFLSQRVCRNCWSVLFVLAGLLPLRLAAQAVPSSQTSSAQAAAPVSPSERPGVIYKAAMHPLEVVRASFGNWSASELAALTMGMRKAREACAQAKSEDYAGDDLCDLARLCMLGQSWPQAQAIARQCLERGPEKRRAHAYAMIVSAQVQTGHLAEAQKTTLAMLRTLPYDAEVASTVLGMKNQLEQDANIGRMLELELAEQPAILEATKRHTALTEEYGDALMNPGELYASAMHLAFQQYYNQDKPSSAATAASLDQALASDKALGGEDAEIVERVRRQYRLLGAQLPAIEFKQALLSATSKPEINPDLGDATVLVLFPDWCVSCRAQMKTLTEFARVNSDTSIHAYGLVFHDDFGIPDSKPVEQDWKDMEGTATLVVEPKAARALGAVDYPLGVVLDHDGVVRFLGVLPDNAFNGDGYVEQVLMRMGAAMTVERSTNDKSPKSDKK
jgi:hypothetical protein